MVGVSGVRKVGDIWLCKEIYMVANNRLMFSRRVIQILATKVSLNFCNG